MCAGGARMESVLDGVGVAQEKDKIDAAVGTLFEFG